MSEEIIKQALSYSLAADLHEEWRLTRKKEDGTFRPRIKISKDHEWNKTHGTNEVDIANTPFNELPSNWQEENLKAAKVVINLVFKKVINEEPISKKDLEVMGTIIHNEWLSRNQWVFDTEFGNPKLAVSYNKLPVSEQKKDISQIKPAIAKVLEYTNGLIDIQALCEEYNIKEKDKVLVKQ